MLRELIKIIEILVIAYFSILFHEFGHYIIAKILRVKVAEFSIGGGNKLFSFVINETKYTFNTPIGMENNRVYLGFSGYCQINYINYLSTGKIKKILVSSGGSLANLLLFLLFIVYYSSTRSKFILIVAL